MRWLGFGDVGDVFRLEMVGYDWSFFEIFLKYYNREIQVTFVLPQTLDNSENNIIFQYKTFTNNLSVSPNNTCVLPRKIIPTNQTTPRSVSSTQSRSPARLKHPPYQTNLRTFFRTKVCYRSRAIHWCCTCT